MREKKKRNRTRIRIGLLFTSVEFGGLETVVKCLIDHLDHDVFDMMPIIFTANRQKDYSLASELQKSGRKYCNIIVDNERIKYMGPIKNLMHVYSLFRDQQFDLIHTHGYRADVIGFMTARALKVPIVATCHGFITNNTKLMFYNSLDRCILKHFNRVIAVSTDIATSLIESGINEDVIRIIPNAVSLKHDEKCFEDLRRTKRELMGWSSKHFVLGYVGRLSEEKGLGFLIGAVSDLMHSSIPVRLVIIGEGSQRADLELMSKKYGTDTSVIFLGFRDDIHSYLPAFDAFILPSLMEGTPMAMLEAMLCGIPVIASKVGGIPDVVTSGKNGILVSPGSSQEIGAAISLLYKDKDLRMKIGREAQSIVKAEYNVKQWIKKIEAEYLRVAEG